MTTIIRATPDGTVQTIQQPAVRVTTLTPLEFMARIPEAKQLAIETAAGAATPQAAQLRLFLRRMTAAIEIDLDHPDTVNGLAAMQAAGLLTAQEVAAIRGLP